MDVTHKVREVEDPTLVLGRFFECLPFPTLVFRPDGSPVAGNVASERMFGERPRPDYNLLDDPSIDDPRFLEAFRRAAGGEEAEVPMTWFTPAAASLPDLPDRSPRGISSKFFPIGGDDGQVIHVVIMFFDRTPELQRHDALQTERDLLFYVFQKSREALIVTNSAGDVIMANPEAERQCGQPFEPGVTKTWLGSYDLCCTLCDGERSETPLPRALRGEDVEEERWNLRTGRGDLKQLLCHASPLRYSDGALGGAVLMAWDETERLRSEQELARAREEAARSVANEELILAQRDRIIEALPAPLVIVDARGQLLCFNRRARELSGLSATNLEEIVQSGRIRQVGAAHPMSLTDLSVMRALHGEEIHGALLAVRTPPTGHERILEVRATPIRNTSGHIVGALSLGQDITERYHIAHFQEQVIHILGHEIRNPLASARLTALGLDRMGPLNLHQVQALDVLKRALDRVDRLICDLTRHTRMQLVSGLPIRPQPLDMRQLCVHILLEFNQRHPDRTLQFEGPDTLPGCWDPDRVAQVLSNLLANALDHGSRDAAVVVSLERDPAGVFLRVHNRLREDGSQVGPRLAGSDSIPIRQEDATALAEGPPLEPHGIPTSLATSEREQERQASSINTYQSRGLGLFIVHEVMTAHGGWSRLERDTRSITITTFWPDRVDSRGGSGLRSLPRQEALERSGEAEA